MCENVCAPVSEELPPPPAPPGDGGGPPPCSVTVLYGSGCGCGGPSAEDCRWSSIANAASCTHTHTHTHTHHGSTAREVCSGPAHPTLLRYRTVFAPRLHWYMQSRGKGTAASTGEWWAYLAHFTGGGLLEFRLLLTLLQPLDLRGTHGVRHVSGTYS